MTLKINTTPNTLPTSLAPLSDSSPNTGGTSQNHLANHVPVMEQNTTSPTSVAPEKLITDTENSRQSTQSNPTTSKLIGETSGPQAVSVAPPLSKPVSVEAVVEKAAKTPATPFEIIPAQFLTADEAKAELLALEKNGDIDVEFTEEGKTVLFVPVFDVNFKKETNTSTEASVKSFTFPQPQEAVSVSRLAEWFSFKGIQDILFRGFTSASTETKTDEPPTTPPAKPSSPPPAVEPLSATPTAETNSPTKHISSATTTASVIATNTPLTSSPASPLGQTSSFVSTGQTTTSPTTQSASSPSTTASHLLAQGVPKPSSPPPTNESTIKPTFQAIPLMQLQKEIASSSSAVPMQKPAGIPKPSSPHPTAQESTPTPTGLPTSRIANSPNTSVVQNQSEPKTSTATTSSRVLSQSPIVNVSAQTTTPSATTSSNLPPTSTTSSSPLSSLGDRLQSLLNQESSPTTPSLSYTNNSLSDLLKGRTSINLPQMDIAGFRGSDPKTGKVIDVHGYRDIIRFNHHSYLQSVQSHRAEAARETIQREVQEREQREKTQRHTEQQELRMLIELEQLRRLNTIQSPATSATTITAAPTSESTRSLNPTEQNPFNIIQDVNAQRFQHQWNEQLNHKK